ncbi:hypothetical protein X975_06691, partial [Stegodyphus mimosarum]
NNFLYNGETYLTVLILQNTQMRSKFYAAVNSK